MLRDHAAAVNLWGERFVLADGQAVDIRSGAPLAAPAAEAFTTRCLTVTTARGGGVTATVPVGGADLTALSAAGLWV